MLLGMSSDIGEVLLYGRGEVVVVIKSAFGPRDLDRCGADGFLTWVRVIPVEVRRSHRAAPVGMSAGGLMIMW
jgi:hypothetical protein